MVKIISDSTCDLSEELKKEFDIDIIPLHILLGENEFEDGIDITPDEIYSWSDKNSTTPKTSAPSLDRAKDIIGKYTSQGMEVICFSISSEMSTSGNIMRLAAEELGAENLVNIIDSRNLSTGIGLLVVEAAKMALDGHSSGEIINHIEKSIPKVRASFVVDTLVYLHRGGRCSGLAALLGGALKLHPKIEVKDGAMGPGKKYRGKMNMVIKNYVKDMEPQLLKAKNDCVFITHSGCDESIIEETKNYLRDLNHFENIYITRAGGVISSHCGYGTLGVLFIEG